MSKRSMIDLLERYAQGNLTQEEQQLLDAWFDAHGTPANTLQQMSAEQREKWVSQLFMEIQAEIPPRSRYRWWPYAAAVAAAIAVFIWVMPGLSEPDDQRLSQAEAFLPIGNRATLTGIDGQIIPLREDQTGIVMSGSGILYGDGATPVFALAGEDTTAPETAGRYLTLSTRRGGMYQLTLPDGTEVWLNAASSIRYPATFDKHARVVEVSGEVFMDVAPDQDLPFVVKLSHQEIEVLGTSFNVDAYDEGGSATTTLIEGRLRVRNRLTQEVVFIEPGQQAQVVGEQPVRIVQVDAETYAAWKSGVYFVDDESLASFGKQIERWYDVEVFMGRHGHRKVSAMIRRDVPLKEVLDAIELQTGILFTMEGRRVRVKE